MSARSRADYNPVRNVPDLTKHNQLLTTVCVTHPRYISYRRNVVVFTIGNDLKKKNTEIELNNIRKENKIR